MSSLRLAARLENLPAFRTLIIETAEEAGLSREQCSGLDVAVEELVVNTASYAYPGGEGELEVDCVRTVEAGDVVAFTVLFRDWGTPFNPLEAGPPDLEADDAVRAQGGLGIHFVREICDRVEYRRSGECNELAITLVASSPPATSPEGRTGPWAWLRRLLPGCLRRS